MANDVTVNTPCKAYRALAQHWDLPQALRGGTLGMRAAGRTYLPQFPKEPDDSYADRLAQSVLFNAFWRTVGVLSAKPFAKPVTLADETDEDLKEWAKNIDGAGRDLTAFAHDLLQDILAYGMCRFAVDAPSSNGELTLEEERRLGIRPYFAHISPLSMIGWQEQRVGAITRLTEARIRHTVTEPVGRWGEMDVQYVYRRTAEQFEKYRKDPAAKGEDEGWPEEPTEAWPNRLGKVTIVTVQFMQDDRPRLDDLGWLNARHWQSQSDQDVAVHMARVPLKHLAGFSEAEAGAVMAMGSGIALRSSNHEARVHAVETTGDAIKVGRDHLQDLKEEMSAFGVDLLIPRKNTGTATGRVIDVRQGESDLQMIVRRLEAGLEAGFRLMGEWVGRKDVPVGVDIYQDFNVNPDDQTHEQRFKRAVAGFITKRTLLEEDKRAGLLSDSVDVEDEVNETDAEDPFREDTRDAA